MYILRGVCNLEEEVNVFRCHYFISDCSFNDDIWRNYVCIEKIGESIARDFAANNCNSFFDLRCQEYRALL